MKRLRSAIVLGTISFVGIFRLHGILIPDFLSYSHGGSVWSSAATAGIGAIWGATGVKIICVLSATLLGWLVGSAILSLLIGLSPVGQGITNAGADALGAAVLVLTLDRTYLSFIFSALAHLVCGLSAVLALAFRIARLPCFIALTISGVGAILAEYLLAILLHKHFSGIQWRYLLPAVIYTARNRYKLFGH